MPGQKPQGLKLSRDVITPEEEHALIASIEASGLRYPPYDPGNRRSSTCYGWDYDYANDTFVPHQAAPAAFDKVRDRAAAFAGVTPDDIAEILLNRYEQGAIIQPHFDKPVWDHVIGISLGASATMLFSRENESLDQALPVELAPRSIYLLAGAARHVYCHSLPPVAATRWSITLRTLSDEGRRLLGGK